MCKPEALSIIKWILMATTLGFSLLDRLLMFLQVIQTSPDIFHPPGVSSDNHYTFYDDLILFESKELFLLLFMRLNLGKSR